MDKVLIIIPAYNEEESIGKVCSSIEDFRKSLREDCPYSIDYVVINDCSTDSTEEICRKNGFPVISLRCNLGIGGAVQTGYKYAKKAGYDVAVQLDGDGQHDVYSLDCVLSPVLRGEADMAVGSRFVDNDTSCFRSTLMRRVGIRLLSAMIRIFSGTDVKDCTSGYRSASKEVISFFVDHYPSDYPEPESIVSLSKKRFVIKEFPVKMHERDGGCSSISSLRSVYYMIKVSLAIIIAGTQKAGEHK